MRHSVNKFHRPVIKTQNVMEQNTVLYYDLELGFNIIATLFEI